MSKFTVTHEIRCNVEAFWKTFFDKDFNNRLYRETLGFPEWKIVEETDTPTEITRKVSASPKMEVPGPVAKLFGSNFRYTEEGKLIKSEGVWRWKMTPSTLADKLFTGGTVRAEPLGEGRVKRIAEMNVEAKIFGVGGLIESSAEKQLRDGWDRSATAMNKFLEEAANKK